MALTTALASAISKGYYIDDIGNKVTYKSLLLDMFKYAKTYGYASALLRIKIKAKFIDRKGLEVKSRIDLLKQDMEDSSFARNYEAFLSFIQDNSVSDEVNMPVFVTTNTILSGRMSSFKDLYHEYSILLYKQKLFNDMLVNLTKNKDSLDTIISDVENL